MEESLYKRLAKSGWLGTGPQITTNQDEWVRGKWKDSRPDSLGDALKRVISKQKESSGG